MTTPEGAGRTGVLESFLADAVIDDYADVPAGKGGPSRVRGQWGAALVLLAIGALVAIAVISTQASDAQRAQTREALSDRVSALTASVSELQASVDARTAEVDALRDRVLSDGDVASVQAQIDGLAAGAAATAVAGTGVIVTVDDAPDASADSLERVLDRDLQDIVNALWRGGAVAVGVNDQRLTATTAIRGAGEAILVNYQPLARPYRVSALGSDGAPIDTTGVSSLLDGLARDYGLVTDLAQGDVALPAGEVRSPRFAEVSKGGSTP